MVDILLSNLMVTLFNRLYSRFIKKRTIKYKKGVNNMFVVINDQTGLFINTNDLQKVDKSTISERGESVLFLRPSGSSTSANVEYSPLSTFEILQRIKQVQF
jgi:hypothetical protein